MEAGFPVGCQGSDRRLGSGQQVSSSKAGGVLVGRLGVRQGRQYRQGKGIQSRLQLWCGKLRKLLYVSDFSCFYYRA